MQRFIVYVLLLYLAVMLFDMSFFFTALSFELPAMDALVFVAPALLAGLAILAYALRSRLGLSGHEKALHYIIYILLAISVFITSVFIIPLFYM